jgi:hypothetical protein
MINAIDDDFVIRAQRPASLICREPRRNNMNQSNEGEAPVKRTVRLYHATTERKARLYRETGYIRKPVRGFTTLQAAMAWAMKVGRTVIYEVEGEAHKLPDHHNKFGEAWWIDANVSEFKCVFSATNDA